MKITIISDVHVKSSGDSAEKILLHFLRHPDVVSSDVIVLLGDIFDLLIGAHSQYYVRFAEFFTEFYKLISSNKKIYYVEGNHDFHLNKLFENYFKINGELNKSNFALRKYIEIEDNQKKIFLSHGDDIEIENFNYKIFKAIVNNFFMNQVANYLIPHFLMKSVGEFSSKKSRKKNNKRYQQDADLLPVKEKFRKSIEVFHPKSKSDIYICGHSHVKDFYHSENGFIYINNGFAENSKTFIVVENGKVKFESLTLC